MKFKKNVLFILVLGFLVTSIAYATGTTETLTTTETSPNVKFVVTDAMQTKCYDGEGNVIDAPAPGEAFYGQDAQYNTIQTSYTDNGDGTITDNNTGLMWQKTPPTDKMTFKVAEDYIDNLEIGGYTDWRLPTILESFSLANLDGKLNALDVDNSVPYIDTEYFDFYYDEAKAYTGSYWTSTSTVLMSDLGDTSDTMAKNYGFNWADGHLKSYADGYTVSGGDYQMSIPAGVRAVRGEEDVFGTNDYVNNNDGTITDNATGLMWSQSDAGYGMDWETALKYAEDSNLAGYDDWRLPTPKELQSLVEYGKATIPAIDENFFNLSIADCYVWTGTTCGDFPEMADYVTFGHGWGIEVASSDAMTTPPEMDSNSSTSELPPPPEMNEESTEKTAQDATLDDFHDVHGPGCIRADYKYGTAPALSQSFYEQITGEDYPGAEWKDGVSALNGTVPEDADSDGDIDEFDLTNSENAADFVVIYNRVMLVRDAN